MEIPLKPGRKRRGSAKPFSFYRRATAREGISLGSWGGARYGRQKTALGGTLEWRKETGGKARRLTFPRIVERRRKQKGEELLELQVGYLVFTQQTLKKKEKGEDVVLQRNVWRGPESEIWCWVVGTVGEKEPKREGGKGPRDKIERYADCPSPSRQHRKKKGGPKSRTRKRCNRKRDGGGIYPVTQPNQKGGDFVKKRNSLKGPKLSRWGEGEKT